MDKTKDIILREGEHLIRKRGYNAFSYNDISKPLGVKNAAIHYHFPRKTDLALGVLEQTRSRFRALQEQVANELPPKKIVAFFGIYTQCYSEEKLCLMGGMAPHRHTLDPEVQEALKTMAAEILDWLMQILEEGKQTGHFRFPGPVRARALVVVSSLYGSLHLTPLTGPDDFMALCQTLLDDLTR